MRDLYLKKMKESQLLMFFSGLHSCCCQGESGNLRLFIIFVKHWFFLRHKVRKVLLEAQIQKTCNESRILNGKIIADLIILEIGYVLKMLCILEWSTIE